MSRALTEHKESEEKYSKKENIEMIEQEKQMSAVPFTPQKNENISAAEEDLFWEKLIMYENSKSPTSKKVAEYVWKLVESGVYHFTTKELSEYLKLNKDQTRKICYKMKQRGIIVNKGNVNSADYYLTLSHVENDSSPQIPDLPILEKLEEYMNSESSRISNTAEILIGFLKKGQVNFSRNEFKEILGLSDRSVSSYVRCAIDIGVIKKINRNKYEIVTDGSVEHNFELTDKQYNMLSNLKDCFDSSFSVSEGYNKLGLSKNTFSYHLKILIKHGDIVCVKSNIPQRFAVKENLSYVPSEDNIFEPTAELAMAGVCI